MNFDNVYISDKTGKKFFRATTSPYSTMPEIRNLRRHIRNAKKHPKHYQFLDIETARVFLNGEPYTGNDVGVDELFNLLISEGFEEPKD